MIADSLSSLRRMTCFVKFRAYLFVLSLGIPNTVVSGQKFEGDTCTIAENSFGECRRIASCDSARTDIQNGKRPQICSYEKNVPIICCPNPNINWSPDSSGSAPLWPSEGVASQLPSQQSPQRPAQRPTQQSPQRPAQRPTQRPIGGPTQRPVQRPPPTQAQQPTRSPEMATQPPTTSPSKTPSKRPQWWQIPKRKRTESPPVIEELMTTPMTEFQSSVVENSQLPPRVQGAPLSPVAEGGADGEKIVFKQEKRNIALARSLQMTSRSH